MLNRKLIYSILIALAALTAILAAIIFYSQKNDLKIIFFNVGQGDAILISEGSQQVLIDGGKDGRMLLEKMGKFVPFWDRNIEAVVMTHPDQDHIGGLIDLLETYKVQNIIETNAQSDSETFKKLEEEILKNETGKIEAKKNLAINFSNGALIQVLSPLNSLPNEIDKNSNDNSVVTKLSYGENKFLFTGDLPSTQEGILLGSKANLESQVLKVAHHGSKYATSNEFLDAVKPEDAVISVGKNSYGHPNQEVLDRLLENKIKILRTDEMGDVEYLCQNSADSCVVVN